MMLIAGKTIQAVIFDVDGTLVDSIPVYFKMVAAMFVGIGLPVPEDRQIKQWVKDGAPDWDDLIPPDMEGQKEALVAKAMSIARQKGPQIFRQEAGLLPGVVEVFQGLAQRGIPIGVATTGSRAFYPAKIGPLKERGIDGLIKAVVTREDAPEIKPHPAPLLACAEKLGVPPEHCLSIGDADVDVMAGTRAGMTVVAVLTGVDQRADLTLHGPHAVLDRIDELLRL